MNRSTVLSLCVLAGMLVLGGAVAPAFTIGGASAQDASSPTLPAAPDPSLCLVEPRSIDEFQVSEATPDETDAPAPGFTIPAGRPADQAMIDAVTNTVIEAAACINARQFLSLENLYTEAGWHGGEVDEFYLGMLPATPEAAAEEDYYAIFAVELVQVLGDGRVAAVVQFQEEGGGGVDLMVFAEEAGRYLIDVWVDGPFDIEPDFSAFE
ncbi:hypothetical protein BH23CHL5_BH23CHL5_23930 [soil metagenome]